MMTTNPGWSTVHIGATLLLLAVSGCAQRDTQDIVDKPPTLEIPYSVDIVVADGNLDEQCYSRHAPLRNFVVAASPDRTAMSTEFWLFWSEEHLVFASRCEDTTLAASKPSDDEHHVDGQDRVELFLWNGDPLAPYYCLELAPHGAIHDYKAVFYRQFDDEWSPVGTWKSSATTTKDGYNIELLLPKSAIEAMGHALEDRHSLYVGLFRADFDRLNGTPTWITWVDHGMEPDFHVAESFGMAVLEEKPESSSEQ